jgi:glycosyltransferase involved in cell wall biosynthesis
MRSVLNQTVRPLELIVVDDCSAHPNESVVADAKGSGLDIRYERLTGNSGASIARNIGAQQARSEVLMFLDDDDTWEPDKIETQLALLERRPDAGWVYTGMLAVDDLHGGKVLHASREHFSGNAWPHILFRNFIGPTSAVAMRAELFRRVGGFDPRLPALQDYDLWLRLGKTAPVLYDGRHNLRFSATPRLGSRLSADVGNYQAGFEYLSRKYRAELNHLTFWQRRRFDAQAALVVASKYLDRQDYWRATLQFAASCAMYPPTLLRLSRAALSRDRS